MTKGIRDEGGFYAVPGAVGFVVVVIEGRGRFGVVVSEVKYKSAKRFRRAEVRIGGGQVSNLFAFDGILLVGEGQRGVFDTRHVAFVIQRSVKGVVNASVNSELDVAEEEGLTT